MSLNETAVYETTIDDLNKTIRSLDKLIIATVAQLDAAYAELALFEKVVMSTHTMPRTLSVIREDGTRVHVESGLGVYIKAESP